jgi:hypothetical protein
VGSLEFNVLDQERKKSEGINKWCCLEAAAEVSSRVSEWLVYDKHLFLTNEVDHMLDIT